jgi:hypothetical protein
MAAAMIFAIAFPPAAAWLYFVELSGSAWINAAYGAGKGIQFAFPVAWLVLAERREWGSIGARASAALGALPWRRCLLPGLASGALAAGIVLATWAVMIRDTAAGAALRAPLASRLREIGASGPLSFLALALFLSFAHSLLEEYYWRWFVFGRLERAAGFAVALAVGSMGFAGHHAVVLWYYLGSGPRPELVWLYSAGVAAGGALWGWLYHRHGSLLPGWISHVMADLAIMWVGYAMAIAG